MKITMEDFLKFEGLEEEDKIAMAEAYRLYECLPIEDKRKIPAKFVDTIFTLGDLETVKRFENRQEINEYKFSEKGKYLLMYMCTFNLQEDCYKNIK